MLLVLGIVLLIIAIAGGVIIHPILFVLAVAGSLAGKRISPAGLGTMRTDNPTFVVLLIGVIVLAGLLAERLCVESCPLAAIGSADL